MKINVHDASLKTATVEVKSLTISGKQVTMGVFRQLEQERLIDSETGAFNGLPWGRVNYFWPTCDGAEKDGYVSFVDGCFGDNTARHGNHLHIVWQHGQELRRACVYPPWTFKHQVEEEIYQTALCTWKGDHNKADVYFEEDWKEKRWWKNSSTEAVREAYLDKAKQVEHIANGLRVVPIIEKRYAELEALPQLFIAV